MSPPISDDPLVKAIQRNCDISDAKDHGIYSMCTMILKLRNHYKWENNLAPWNEPEPGDLLDWIEARENYWASIGEKSYVDLPVDKKQISPYDVEKINLALTNTDTLYGAGYGRSMKSIFFFADIREQRKVAGCPLYILGKEYAKEMASPFAMVQEGVIFIRRESLRFFLWDQIQESGLSCRSPFLQALADYGMIHDDKIDINRVKMHLDTMLDNELEMFVYHEVGEIRQNSLDSKSFQTLISRFPGSIIELVCRAVKDLLADSSPHGLLAFIIRERRSSSLALYLTFLDGLREKFFPEISESWKPFLKSRDWQLIEKARSECWVKNHKLAEKIMDLARIAEGASDEHFADLFYHKIAQPLGLEIPQQ